MRSRIYITAVLSLAIVVAFYGCRKSMSGVSNNQVVETPFSLFFSDTAGGLYSSNDGKNIRETLFKADGTPSKAICVANTSLLWAKTDLLISTNNGINFNHSFDSLGSYPGFTCGGMPIDLNQSMMIDIPAWNRVYMAATEDWQGDPLGVRYSLFSGTQGQWYTDQPDTNGAFGGYGISSSGDRSMLVTMTSFTQLANGTLCGYDGRHNRNFYLTSNVGVLWKETTSNPNADTTVYTLLGTGHPSYYGLRLPHHDSLSTPPDVTARYSYGHLNNRLIAIDNINCNNGAYYSDDTGRNWLPFTGLPNAPLLCVSSPFEEICLIGTGGKGLYMYNQNTGIWQVNNNGLGTNLIVHNIAFKENIYKDASIKKFIFLATNQGIYMSTDMGTNWTRTITGNYVTIY